MAAASPVVAFERQEPVRTDPGRVRVKQLLVDAPLGIPVFTLATVPSAFGRAGEIVHISDAPSGFTMVFSDGSNWLSILDASLVA